ncbi:B3GN6 acetylglucosaminyltransferase, partial [Geococcyx californianus]|nr:B3GN6 acetylglucosaminyltransferase [Geococcyx californianus]
LSPLPCSHPPPFLLVLVPSAPSHFARRQAIRETWGGWHGGGRATRTLFVLGVPGESREEALATTLALGAEASRHGDVL